MKYEINHLLKRDRGVESRSLHISYFIFHIFLLSGCYSFTGSSIPPHIHTIGIPGVEDNSGWGQSDVRQNLTDLLIQKFTNEGSLRVANRSNSDALLEASIAPNGIIDEAVSVSVGEVVKDKRITLRVHAKYTDQKKQKVFWERDFSQTANYQIIESLTGQKKAIHQAEDQVAEQIMIAVISNW
ncbi:MAG: LptE family protein [Bacteroidota bacterium]|nr:LptE family protein [Bacteroidota bacterium]MDP4231925.1 LptE family protein [Bacteroidota bacterium]MDP4241368.1 LptE family protein [Bacteroidota bacterium]MDP4287291.1 LptE family protein [Bacteroidota bacterium]